MKQKTTTGYDLERLGRGTVTSEWGLGMEPGNMNKADVQGDKNE